MHHDIAVYVGENGETATPLHQNGVIKVYRKNQGNWSLLREKEFAADTSLGLKGFRQQMEEVLRFLDDCKIFVGLSVTGIPYFELEKAQCSIWEFEGTPPGFLDYILKKEEEARAANTEETRDSIPPAPVEISNGYYRVSLKEIQANKSGFTSKQVLLPFLRQGMFYSLEILCNHIPPWLETELMAGDFACVVEETGKKGEIKMVIAKKCCQ